MREKLSIEQFRKYKEEQQQLLGRLGEEEKVLIENGNYNEEDFLKKGLEELSELQSRLLSYDLSDISFEEWKDIALVSSDKYPADFYKTKANLDFEILDIPITGKEIYNFKGCNVKNIESLESYSDTFFDEKTIEENSSLFLSDKFSQDIKDKYYSYNLSIKDISNLSDEQINELENNCNVRNRRKNGFTSIDRRLINILGLKKNIELYKQDATEYKNIEDIVRHYFDADSLNNLENASLSDIKLAIYKEVRNQAIKNGFYYKFDQRPLKESDYTTDFIEQNKDLFLKDSNLPQDIKDRYFNKCLTYQDVKDNLEAFKTIPIEYFMERDNEFTRLCEYLGAGNFQKLLEKYPETIDYLMKNNEAMVEIVKRLPFNSMKTNNENEMVEYFFKETVKDYYIEYAKNNNINILDINNFPLWLKPLNINKIVDKYQDINDLLRYNTNTLLLDGNQRKTFTKANFMFIKQFEDETYFFSKHGMNTINILRHIDLVNSYSYDEFQEKIATELWNIRNKHEYFQFDYDYIQGEFRNKHKEIFLEQDAPETLKKAFYNFTIDSTFIKEHPDCLEYISTSNRPLRDFFEAKTRGLIDNIEKTLGRTEGYKLIIPYLKYFEKIYFNYNEENLTKTTLLDEINNKIFKNIIDGNVDYNNDMPESFKKKYPSLFIDEKAPKEIKDKFYNGKFTLEDFNNDINIFDYFKNTNIAYAFGKDYYWTIPLFENIDNDKANYSRLKIIAEYQKIPYYDLGDTFKEYCSENASNLEDDKIRTIVIALEKLSYSNSSEMYKLKKSIASQVIKLPNPLEKLDNIEKIFTKNSLPTVGKIYSCFEILHPDFDGFNFTDSMVSPILKHKSNMGREFTVFSDLIRTTFASNNRSVNNYLSNIEIGSTLYENIKNNKTSYNELSEKDKEELSLFSKYLETLYNNTRQGKKEESIITSTNDLEKINNLVMKLSPDGSDNYNIADRVVRMFCCYAGIDTLKEAKNFISNKVGMAEIRNTEEAKKDMTLEKGDFIKGIGNITYLGNMLQNGSVSKEYLGADATSDLTPLDTDVSMILKDDGTISEKISKTEAASYGPIYFVLKNDDRVMITRDSEGEKNLKNDMTKLETFYTGVLGSDHYGIRTGFSSSDINYIVTDSYDERIGLEIAMNGFYIPVANEEGKITFSRDDYDNLRSKMNGLSYYGMDNYIFSDNLITEETEEIKNELEDNNVVTSAKREKINKKIAESINKLGLELKDKIDGDLTEGKIELIDTGSTGRGTNKPGDGDFDFMMRLDKSIMLKSNKLAEVKNNILASLGKEDTNEITGKGDFRLKNVNIGDENVDVDISFVTRTDKVNYSTDMALEDRLATIKQLDKEKYQYVVANILLAKQVLKEANVYKPSRSDVNQGGLGGVGIENWILQNGGSFIDAAESFLAASEDKSFEEFKQNYQIWDFGENHMASSRNSYPHDNFVENMNSDGYEKMTSTLKKYINTRTNSETIQK